MDHSDLPENLIVGIGNPLLDISVVADQDLLQKYELKPNGAIMAEPKHIPLYAEITSEKYKTDYIAGGSVQNTMRVIQWMIKKPKVSSYIGCIGDDKFGKILKDKAVEEGVNVLYQVNKEVPTGTCAVLVTKFYRSLCANLAAAQKFTSDHLELPECKKAIDSAKFFYTSGFFVAVSHEALMKLAKHSVAYNQIFAFNLSATFVSKFYSKQVEELMPYVDIVFGNDDEAKAFAKAFNLKSKTVQDIAVEMSCMPKMDDRPRVVVITQGQDDVILVDNGKISTIPVIEMSPDKIVDTNGAGDAFAGGFLSQLLIGKSHQQAVDAGIYAAHHVIQQQGCTFSHESKYIPKD